MDTKETLLDIFADGGEWEDMEPVIDELIAKNAALEARLKEAEAVIKQGMEDLEFGGKPQTALGHAILKWRDDAAEFLKGAA